MIGWLYHVPNFATIALITGALVAAVVLAPFIGRAVLAPNRSREAAAFEVVKLLCSLMVVFLGFSLNQVIARFQAEEQAISVEAAHIYSLDRALLTLDSDAGRQARAVLNTYVRNLVELEFPALFNGVTDPTAGATFVGLVTLIQAPPIAGTSGFTTIARGAEQVSNDRLIRLNRARDSLPRVYWRAVVLLLAVLIAGCVMLEARWSLMVPFGLYVGAIGILISLVAIFDQPLRGETNVGVSDLRDTAVLMQTGIIPAPQ